MQTAAATLAGFTSETIALLRQIQTARNARLASAIIVFYDYFLTFDREVDLIWRTGWRVPKVIYLINRYYAMASALFSYYVVFAASELSPNFLGFSLLNFLILRCANYYRWEGWTGLVGCMLAEIILQMRIYALYSHNTVIIRLMLALFVACSGAAAITMGLNLRGVQAFPILIPNGHYCDGVPLPHLYGFWIPIILFEGLMCALALSHAYEAYKSDNYGMGIFRAFDNQRFSSILVRDSVVYFLAIGAVYLACLIVWRIDQIYEAPAGFSIAMSSVLGSRLILNLREAHANQTPQYSSDTGVTILTMNIPDLLEYE